MNHQKAIKGLIVVLIILGVITAIVLYSFYGTYRHIRENPMVAFQNTEIAELEENDINYDVNAHIESVTIDGKTYNKKQGVVSILLLGIDWDGTAVKDATGARSDMIMLCTIDTETNEISLLSIPRDTRTVVHKVDLEEGKIEPEENLTKINHAYILGGGNDESLFGPENAMRATEDLIECYGQLSIPIQRYVSIDIEHLADLADVFGGVEITLDQDYPDIGSAGETVTLQGEAVRLYLQNRKQMDDGEMDRQKHEQEFLKALAKKIKEMGGAKSASKLFTQLNNNILKTNLTLDQVVAMAGVLDKVASVDDLTMDRFEETDTSWQMFPDPIVSNPPELDYFVMNDDELMNKMLNLYYTEAV